MLLDPFVITFVRTCETELPHNIGMNEKINLYDTLLKVVNSGKHLFYINDGHATLMSINEAEKTITFSQDVMAMDIIITGDMVGELVEVDDIEWEDQGDYFDIRVVDRVDIRGIV